MFEKIMAFIKASQAAQIALALIIGMAIGALFYPTRHIEEKYQQKYEQDLSKQKEEWQVALTKQQEQYVKLYQENQQYHKESEAKITSLTTENSSLKSHQKTAHYKLVKPDGTIEEKDFTETDIDESKTVVVSIQQEYKEKVDAIEKKWEQIHLDRVKEMKQEFASKEESYQKTISELTKSKVEDVNKKSFGLEGGFMTNGDYYGHVTYDIFGPIFLGAGGAFGPSPAASIGAGIRF